MTLSLARNEHFVKNFSRILRKRVYSMIYIGLNIQMTRIYKHKVCEIVWATGVLQNSKGGNKKKNKREQNYFKILIMIYRTHQMKLASWDDEIQVKIRFFVPKFILILWKFQLRYKLHIVQHEIDFVANISQKIADKEKFSDVALCSVPCKRIF